MDVTPNISAAGDSFRDHFFALFQAAAIGIGICDLEGRILKANPALASLLAVDPQELPGRDPWQLRAPAEPPVHRFLADLLGGQRECFVVDRQISRGDGSGFWGHLTVSLARNALGEPAFLAVFLEDATGRKQLEEALRQAEKMELIGRLAGGIAHDFNNLLTGILLYCDLMLGELEPESKFRHHVEEVRMAGEQGAALTHQLLALGRKPGSGPCAFPINEVASSMEDLLRRLIGEQIELITSLDPSAGMVYADAGQLRQALLNLVLNARDAVRTRVAGKDGKLPKGKIRVSTQAPSSAHSTVALTIEDNGCGMSRETRAHLFQPFFTTKKAGEGTGMGLANVQQFVSASGGSINVNSALGSGTRIEVLLPATDSKEQTRPAESARNQTDHSRETILLVDDHVTVRGSNRRVLLREDYRVFEANSGSEALNIFAGNASAIDLLIADCSKPEMTGRKLALRLRQMKPELRVLLISEDLKAAGESPHGSSPPMSKPFSANALVDRVREILDRPDNHVSQESTHVNRIFCACPQPCSAAPGGELSQPVGPR